MKQPNLKIDLRKWKEIFLEAFQEMFPGAERKRKSFQNAILNLREELEFTDRHLRIAISIIRENIQERANSQYLRKILTKIKGISMKLSFNNALSKAKILLKRITKDD